MKGFIEQASTRINLVRKKNKGYQTKSRYEKKK